MNQFLNLIVLISLINLAFAMQSSIIFPGSTRSSVSSKYDDRTYTDLPPKRPDQNNEWSTSEASKVRNTGIRVVNNNNNYQNSNTNEMKNFVRKNNLNSLGEKAEESRISESKKKLSVFDDLPYDFSKTEKIHRVSDLLRFLGIEERNKQADDGLGLRRSSTDDPMQVACHSEFRTVDLAVELNKSSEEFKLFPQCIKAKRCAGCCGFNSGRTCLPTKKEKVNVYAAVIRVKRSCDETTCSTEIDKDNLRKMFQIDNHEECACKCRLNPDDCNENQEYDEDNCKCVCKESDRMKDTCEQNAVKKFNDKNCQCECRKVLACSTGLVFSNKSCSCARKGH